MLSDVFSGVPPEASFKLHTANPDKELVYTEMKSSRTLFWKRIICKHHFAGGEIKNII